MKKDYWGLVKDIAEKVGNQKVAEQADEHIKAIETKAEKIERQIEMLKNL